MNPSFILTFITGLILVVRTEQYQEKWFLYKFFLVFLHGSISYVLWKGKERF